MVVNTVTFMCVYVLHVCMLFFLYIRKKPKILEIQVNLLRSDECVWGERWPVLIFVGVKSQFSYF